MGFVRYVDDQTGAPYWHDAATGETTWREPAAAGGRERRERRESPGRRRGGGTADPADGAVALYDAGLPTNQLLDAFMRAKSSKNFAESDSIRQQLKSRGIDAESEFKQGTRRQGDWDCEKCGILNFGSRSPDQCYKCGAPKPRSTEDLTAAWKRAKQDKDFASADRLRDELKQRGVDAESLLRRPGDWTCAKCRFVNFAKSGGRCFKCGADKPADADAPGGGGGGGGWGGSGGSGGRAGGGGGGGGGKGGGPPLPRGWEEHFDTGHRRAYWHNAGTGETTWTHPGQRSSPY